jgi:hypothetical protein
LLNVSVIGAAASGPIADKRIVVGRVFSILRVEEVRHFKGLLRKVDNAFVKDHVLPREQLEAARPEVEHALGALQAYLANQF